MSRNSRTGYEDVLWQQAKKKYPKLREDLTAHYTALLLLAGSPISEPIVLPIETQRAFSTACTEMFGMKEHRFIRAVYKDFLLWYQRQRVTQ